MSHFAVFEAKNRLSELVHRVERGEDIAITRRGKVVARLVAADAGAASQPASAAIDRLKSSRRGVSLDGLTSADLLRSGSR